MIESGHQGRGKRRFPRVAVQFAVRMIDVDLKRTDAFPSDTPCYETHFVSTNATGKNISEGGFAFESRRKPTTGSILGLEIGLPQQEKHCASAPNPSAPCGGKSFRAMGEVVWTAALEKKYQAGVRFIDVNPRRSAALRVLIADDTTRPHSSRFIRGGTRDILGQS